MAEERFEVKVIRSARKTFAVQVSSDGNVTLRAPLYVTGAAIRRVLDERREWIMRKRREAEKDRGETAAVRRLTAEELRELAEQAAAAIPPVVEKYARMLHVSYGRITIRCQKTRWGSCSAQGSLSFNCLLMLAPAYVLEGVAAHEVCHRKHMDHSKAFYTELYRICPDYDTGADWLKKNGRILQASAGNIR